MTDPVPVPAAVLSSDFPAPTDRQAGTFNSKAFNWAESARAMSVRDREIATATYTNAVVAKEQAQAAAGSATAADGNANRATEQADAAMGYRNTAGVHATTATTQAGIATTQAGEAAASASQASTQKDLAQQAVADAAEQVGLAAAQAVRAEEAAASIADGPVTSVNNKTGVVNLLATDIAAAATAAEMQAGVEAGFRSLSPLRVKEAVLAHAPKTLLRDARTSNVQLVKADSGKLIDITNGTFTQPFAAASALGNGWFCYLKNSGSGDITLDPNAAELIDGLTSYIMYPGEVRLVQCDGATLRSVVLNSFFKTFTASGTFIKPPGYSFISGLLWGAGGSGRNGGADARGGGGGACHPFSIKSETIANVVTITIGAGGNAVTVPAGDGNRGGTSSLGSLVEAGGGYGGTVSSGYGGGAWVGTVFDGPIGSDYGPSSTSVVAYFGGGTANPSNSALTYQNSHYGGGAGGTVGSGTVFAAGVSKLGGSGGAASLTINASAGFAPGGGGGAATGTGAFSGAGARGELRIWGII